MKLELFVPTLGLKNDFRKSNFRGNETCNETLLNQFKKRMIRKFLSFLYLYLESMTFLNFKSDNHDPIFVTFLYNYLSTS